MASRRVHGPLRMAIGVALIALALTLALLARGLGWGLSVMLWVPALVLCLPALALLRRQRLEVADGELRIDSGWLFRRRMALPLAALELEVLPTAGWRALLATTGSGEYPLATWLSPRRADELAGWLDEQAGRPLPRRTRERHRLDV